MLTTAEDVLHFLVSNNGYINDYATHASIFAGDQPGNPKFADQAIEYKIFTHLKQDGLIAFCDSTPEPKNHYRVTDKGRAKLSS